MKYIVLKTKVQMLKTYHFLILLYFTVPYVLEVVDIYFICLVEILY